MNLALLAPAALAALAALLLPLLIHLQRRPEQKPLSFAAWRWVSERVRPRQRLRWTQWLLLLLRLALIAVLVLLLAQPVRLAFLPEARPWRVVVPGVPLPSLGAIDAAARRDWNWLAPGFPTLESDAPPAPADVSSLLRELDTRLPDGATLDVWVPDPLSGLDAERVALSRAVQWHVVAVDVPDAPVASEAPTRIALFDGGEVLAARTLRAAVAAWNAEGPQRFELVSSAPDQGLPAGVAWAVIVTDHVPASIPDWVAAGGVALHVPVQASSTDSAPVSFLSRRVGQGRLIAASQPLRIALWPQLLEGSFPRELRAVFEGPSRAPPAVAAESVRPLAGAARLPPPAWPLDGAFALLAAALFALERLLAALAQRRSAP